MVCSTILHHCTLLHNKSKKRSVPPLPPPIFFHFYKSPVLFIDDIQTGKGPVESLLNITKANFCVVLLINKQK